MSTKPRVDAPTTKINTENQSNGMTDEQIRYALAAIGRRKNDPGYFERLLEGAQDARRRISAEFLDELGIEATH